MKAIRLTTFLFLILTTSCVQPNSVSLPVGVEILENIDPFGLQSPLWSPDGTKIVASYEIYNMPDIIGIFQSEPRHDIVMINTTTWELTVIASQDSGTLVAEAWLPDNTGFAMLWSDGYSSAEIYLFDSDGKKLKHLSSNGSLSPDMTRIADTDDTSVSITDIQTQVTAEYKLPFTGSWVVNSWSPDMRQLVLTYHKDESERFFNIYLLELISGAFTQFTDDNDYYKYSPAISPNGKLLAYSAHRFYENEIDDKLIISTLDHSCEWVLPLEYANSFTWSPDSQRMFIGGSDGVYVADLNIVFGSDFKNGYRCS